MAQEQVQLEFVEELQEVQMIQQQMQQWDAKSCNGTRYDAKSTRCRHNNVSTDYKQIESRKAKLIAEMQEDYAKEEEKIMGEYGGDPLLRLKGRELIFEQQENQRKEEEGQERLDLR